MFEQSRFSNLFFLSNLKVKYLFHQTENSRR